MSNDKRNSLVPTSRQKNSTILLHAIGHTVSSDDVGADTVLPSLYGLDLRINKYNNGVQKINGCLEVFNFQKCFKILDEDSKLHFDRPERSAGVQRRSPPGRKNTRTFCNGARQKSC